MTSAGEGPLTDAKNDALGAMGISYKAKDEADKVIDTGKDMKTGDKSKDVIYLFGPQNKIFKFVVKTRSWEALKSDKTTLFKAGIKHMSLVALND